MLVISGSINTSRPGIDDIIEQRDKEALFRMVREALDFGAEVISVNCGTRINTEVDDIEWMVRSIMSEFEVPMCIDSPNADAQAIGLSLIKTPDPIIDSISADPAVMNAMLPLAERYNARVIALAMDEKKMPTSTEDRLRMVQKMKAPLKSHNIPFGRVYVDPLVFPIATGEKNALNTLEAIRAIKQEEPEFKTCIGLDNISHGLPKRELLTNTYLAMAVANGLDATFIVLNDQSKPLLTAMDTLMGNDPYCMNYLKAYRSGFLG
ncbi:dihydropteroate synthase [Clostridia bacterium]|nr:dihydropteroate synthase [Clostridia bacterium]